MIHYPHDPKTNEKKKGKMSTQVLALASHSNNLGSRHFLMNPSRQVLRMELVRRQFQVMRVVGEGGMVLNRDQDSGELGENVGFQQSSAKKRQRNASKERGA